MPLEDKEGESKYVEARVEGFLNSQPVTDLLMKKIVVKVVAESGEVLEEATFHNQVT